MPLSTMPYLLGTVLSVSPGMSASPFFTMDIASTARFPSTMHPRTDYKKVKKVSNISWYSFFICKKEDNQKQKIFRD
jgi:hypothetical protein